MTEELRDKLEKAHDAAWEAYQKVAAPAWEAYQAAIDSAEKAYDEAIDSAKEARGKKAPITEEEYKKGLDYVFDASAYLKPSPSRRAANVYWKAFNSAMAARKAAIDRATAAYEKVERPAREVYEKLREELEEKLRAKYGEEASDD
jgi:hypothetical protein